MSALFVFGAPLVVLAAVVLLLVLDARPIDARPRRRRSW